jgi:hypothetical protein
MIEKNYNKLSKMISIVFIISVFTFLLCINLYLKIPKSLIVSNKKKLGDVIPKRIVQTWPTHNLGNLEKVAETWKNLNPTFTYTLFDDTECENLIYRRFEPRVWNAYTSIKAGAFKADLWRYCELYLNGGVYVDIDTVCLGSIDDILDPTATLITPIDFNPVNLFNAFIAVVPGHPVMLMCIKKIVENVESNKKQFGLDFSGPGVLGECVAKYLGMPRKPFVLSDTINKGVQFLNFDKNTEIVSNVYGQELMVNKNGNINLLKAYEGEMNRAGIVKYEW